MSATSNRIGFSLILSILCLFAIPSAASALTLKPPVSYPLPGNTFSVAIGDLNDDDRPDLVTADLDFFGVSVLLGTGNGSFGAATDFSTGAAPQDVKIGDVNRDGIPDIVTANQIGDNISVLLGTGSGSFGAPISAPSTGLFPNSLAIGDINNDAKPDLVTANVTSSDVSVLLGNGNGSFVAQPLVLAGTTPSTVVLKDFNNDGNLDFAARNETGISIRIGAGDGTFGGGAEYPVGLGARIATADLNKDGKPDLVTDNDDDSTLSVLLGVGDGTFGTPTALPSLADPADVAIGDMNGDRIPDLVESSDTTDSIGVLIGDGTGAFAPPFAYPSGGDAYALALGDLNDDGSLDVAVSNGNSNTVSVLLNGPTAAPSSTFFTFGSPTPVPQGTTSAPQTVTFTNFGTAPLKVRGFALSGTNPGDFFTVDNQCGDTIEIQSSCQVSVVFSPKAQGARSAILTPLTNAGDNAAIALTARPDRCRPVPPAARVPPGPRD